MRILLLVLIASLGGCRSIDRLFSNSPMAAVEPEAQRINMWPLYYQSGTSMAVLWPIFDQDEKGFALRPLITKHGSQWEFLPPLSWFNTETGDWVFLPAWWIEDSHGVFPLYGVWDQLRHVGPAWWENNKEGELSKGGLFPLLTVGEGFNNVGPVWWCRDEQEELSYGLFPLIDIGKHNNLGPVFWGYRSDDALRYLVAAPLFAYAEGEEGKGMFVTLLGGRGWDEKGKTTFLNVLGPVFHYGQNAEAESSHFAVLYPLFQKSDSPRRNQWELWPLLSRTKRRDKEGEPTGTETTALAGIVRHRGLDGTDVLRVLPLFSYRSKDGGSSALGDLLTVVAYKDKEDGSQFHLGTPLVFNYRSNADGYRWNSLLGTVHYQKHEDTSEFRLLYYLYRQKTKGTATQRDIFPFISWDTGKERSKFSFLWRIFNWERNGDKVGGHVLFIPWGN